MPLPFLADIFYNGRPDWMPEPLKLLQGGLALSGIALLKMYSRGATNKSERNMHGRVIMMTGGTSGIGAVTAYELARRGAQLILLTRLPPSDPFLVDYIDDLRSRTNNEMIYAEHVDLSSLYSIRKFATKWIDNAPPRRLDMIILNAATLTPPGMGMRTTKEGVEETWMVNYLANFHLLGILSPAIKAQPFDRDVRVVITTCSSYESATPLAGCGDLAHGGDDWSGKKAYARSKLALVTFGRTYQKFLDAYKRPDELPMNSRVVFADPGYTRTAGTRRWLSRGSIWGLILYLVFYGFAWLFLKSASMGAQSVLYAVMEAGVGRGEGGKVVKECQEVGVKRGDVDDEGVAKKLWEESDALIEKVEKAEARRRGREKKEAEMKEEERKEREKVEEIGELVDTINKGKEKEKEKAQQGKGQGQTVKKRSKKA